MAAIIDRKITLHNDGTVVFEGRWDGRDYEIHPRESLEIDNGIAKHFSDPDRYPGNELRIEEIIPGPISSRNPASPLEEGDRGKGFAKITSTKKEAAE